MAMEFPDTIDIIATDPKRVKLLLVMTQHRPWAEEPMRKPFHAKANAYANYALSEQFTADQPDFAPTDVIVKLDCAYPPDQETLAFFRRIEQGLARYGIGFEYEVCR